VIFILVEKMRQLANSLIANPTLANLYTQCVGVFVLSAFLVMAVLVFLAVNTTRLVVSPEGIEYAEPGYTIFAAWKDVDHTHNFGYWRYATEALILRKSRLRAHHWLAWFVKFTGSDRIIPIARFDLDWRTGELGDYIRKYASHVNL
jgi:hypothetical protein